MDYNKIEKREYNIYGEIFSVMNTTKLYIDILFKKDYEEGIPFRIRLKEYNGLFYFNHNQKKVFFCDEQQGLILNNLGDPVCSNCKCFVGQNEESPGVVNKKGQAFCNRCYNIILGRL